MRTTTDRVADQVQVQEWGKVPFSTAGSSCAGCWRLDLGSVPNDDEREDLVSVGVLATDSVAASPVLLLLLLPPSSSTSSSSSSEAFCHVRECSVRVSRRRRSNL